MGGMLGAWMGHAAPPSMGCTLSMECTLGAWMGHAAPPEHGRAPMGPRESLGKSYCGGN